MWGIPAKVNSVCKAMVVGRGMGHLGEGWSGGKGVDDMTGS